MTPASSKLYARARVLGIFTIVYNVIEGVISVILGAQDEALTLLGFGIDSAIEVLSGIGILVMILRIERNVESQRTHFETNALRITGTSFYLLSLGLLVTVLVNFLQGSRPEATLPGILIGLLSIATMAWLAQAKIAVGRALGSSAIIADGHCTRTCLAMSVILLLSSLLYQFTGFGWTDSLGALGLVYYSIKEGREAFAKARNPELSCACHQDSLSA